MRVANYHINTNFQYVSNTTDNIGLYVIDYCTFGSLMGGRQFNSTAYAYSFNTQLKSDEISGVGNHTTALFWEYDTRLGRRWNVDPKPIVSVSSYSTFIDNPILYSDVLGDKVNVKDMSDADKNNKTDYTQKVLKDWGEIGGLKINQLESGDLDYSIDENATNYSETARADLIKFLGDKDNTYNLKLSSPGAGSEFKTKDNIVLDPKQIEGFINGVRGGLSPKTLGWGMVALHELNHDNTNGFGAHIGYTDPEHPLLNVGDFGFLDPLVRHMNVIRFEMTSATGGKENYGQRMSYFGKTIAGEYIFPFDGISYGCMLGEGRNLVLKPSYENAVELKIIESENGVPIQPMYITTNRNLSDE